MRLVKFILLFLSLGAVPSLAAGMLLEQAGPVAISAELAGELFEQKQPLLVTREETGVPGWKITRGKTLIGYLGSTWEISDSVGYSGRPIDVLVAISSDAKIRGARLLRHNEPVLTLGISDEDINRYVGSFAGIDLKSGKDDGRMDGNAPDVISRATVSTGVIRDSILRTARTLAIGRSLVTSSRIDRLSYEPKSWAQLLEMGALAQAHVSMEDAAIAFDNAKVPVPAREGSFLDLYAGLIDPPTVGRSLLGQQDYTRAIGAVSADETVLIVMSSGLQSHRGTKWKRSGLFERLALYQEGQKWPLTSDQYEFVRKLHLADAPQIKEISLFRLPSDLDPEKAFTVEVTASRPARRGEKLVLRTRAEYTLPAIFRLEQRVDEPLWREIWSRKTVAIYVVGFMLLVLAMILFFQEAIVARPRLWRYGRSGFLLVSFLVLGMGLNGQLSVVQVVAFVHSLLNGFRWETFLIEPVIFMLWGFVALGLLFWGRGVYCGWLCPFGALQELVNIVARYLKIPQIEVPQSLHERLWVIKYTLFVGILALSFYSMHDALVLAEAEPFKTAISLRMMRAWPFVLFVLALLVCGLFISRFYCRYMCPLGAGLAIPAKLKIFDWLHRRPQCGRECRLCETKCTVGAIDGLGRINPNECVLCLHCQVTYHDASTCTVLKRRAARNAPPAARKSEG